MVVVHPFVTTARAIHQLRLIQTAKVVKVDQDAIRQDLTSARNGPGINQDRYRDFSPDFGC
jgi:hypothetical protein